MNKLSKIVLSAVILCFLAGSVYAQNVNTNALIKAVIFDNETGAKLTTATQNIGIRLLITNTAATAQNSVLELPNINLGMFTLTNMKVNPPKSGGYIMADTQISWPISVVNTYGSMTVAVTGTNTAAVAVSLLPVVKAQVQGPATTAKRLPQGLYYPTLNLTTYNSSTGATTLYTVKTEPITIE